MSSTVYTAKREDKFLTDGYPPERRAQNTSNVEMTRHGYGFGSCSLSIDVSMPKGHSRWTGDDEGIPEDRHAYIHLTPTQVREMLRELAYYFPRPYLEAMPDATRGLNDELPVRYREVQK